MHNKSAVRIVTLLIIVVLTITPQIQGRGQDKNMAWTKSLVYFQVCVYCTKDTTMVFIW